MTTEDLTRSTGSVLSTLRDIEGVHGSFFISQGGRLIGKDLPAVFDEPLFAEVGPRLVRLREALADCGDEVDWCLLRYTEHKLFVRSTLTGLLCVLTSVVVNMPALRMAVNLAARRINAALAGLGELPAVPPAPQPAVHAPPVQVYRGHVVR